MHVCALHSLRSPFTQHENENPFYLVEVHRDKPSFMTHRDTARPHTHAKKSTHTGNQVSARLSTMSQCGVDHGSPALGLVPRK